MVGTVVPMVIPPPRVSKTAGVTGRGPALVCLHPADITIENHSIRLEGLPRRAMRYGPRTHVELRSVPRARHRRSVEGAFVQGPSPVRAFRLRGTEASPDVEDGHGADQQGRARRHLVHAELAALERGWLAGLCRSRR